MDSYDMIDSIRIKNWIGPKPNANPHIAIYPLRLDCSEVGFTIQKEKE
jgi:hypothetical protein